MNFSHSIGDICDELDKRPDGLRRVFDDVQSLTAVGAEMADVK